ncbi:Glyoxalase/Bleomycin resistance protein/Dioxygenase superfamily protein [compost metagenome]|jgi:catechol 2,3-dioxygenase-like lactoylglutathione lyase family enzyme|uniref:Catechol 2,3-dioxygenase-like lactoylglutathione lyase family enzyme n=1 Tax=Variovorax guangxiensis TaxID=1775474 RepID=A0A840GAB9_9BURK|nr:VOC family protein [Variovorax guangxiensis]MBB4226121.1 catechol 2,3-dioxygenase-like lactoylglutathione lyase family enzyme [Variovorax guangxiensis]
MDNVLRVQHLAGYGLEVPDLGVAEQFFTAFGLNANSVGGALQMQTDAGLAAASAPEVVALKGGTSKRLHHLSFAIRPEDLPRFEERLHGMGVRTLTPPFGRVREGLWFQDPWGTWINLAPSAPLEAPAPVAASPEPRVDRHLWQDLRKPVRPRKLGHLLMFTNDWEKSEAFFADALGLRVADRAAGKVSFMSGGTGVRDHHCFGLIKDSHRGFQHSSFHVGSLDEIGLGGLQMHKAGYQEGFGVGRHALASNLFHYTRDPWGSWIEYYSDMDKISEAWVSKDWNDLPYIWPQWAPEFWGKEMNANLEPR